MVVTRSQTCASKKRTDMGFRTLTSRIPRKPRYYAAGKLAAATYYKAFNRGMKACRDFQYNVGETYTQQPRPILCQSGFHACKLPLSCLRYYASPSVLCEVQILGDAVSDGGKLATNKIKIVRRIPAAERDALLTGTITQHDHNCEITNTYRKGTLHDEVKPSVIYKYTDGEATYNWYINGRLSRAGNAPASCNYGELSWFRYGTQYYPSMEIQDEYYTINADGERVVDMDAALSGGK
jgi:hypothetical protein